MYGKASNPKFKSFLLHQREICPPLFLVQKSHLVFMPHLNNPVGKLLLSVIFHKFISIFSLLQFFLIVTNLSISFQEKYGKGKRLFWACPENIEEMFINDVVKVEGEG